MRQKKTTKFTKFRLNSKTVRPLHWPFWFKITELYIVGKPQRRKKLPAAQGLTKRPKQTMKRPSTN